MAEVSALLRDGARLVTLTGPGGSGKTRLAIEAAAELVPEFKAGVFWVGLAPLRDPTLVTGRRSRRPGREGRTRRAHRRARDAARARQPGAGDRCAPGACDAGRGLPEPAAARHESRDGSASGARSSTGRCRWPSRRRSSSSARARRLEPDEAVSELCRRLDNLPLAVELAAARASVLSPAQILERLAEPARSAQRRAGRRPAPADAAGDDRVEPRPAAPGREQLFARLAVFVGGCTLEAAEEVADADLDTLQSLVDKSLVRHTGERFWMLETIREYAVEHLDALGDEAADIRRRLANHLLLLAREAQTDLLRGLHQRRWHAVLDAELDNVRAVLAWGFKEDPVSSVELAAALGRYWWMRRPHEGTTWLERAAAVPDLPRSVRAEALEALGGTVWFLGEAERTGVLVAESLELYREIADPVATGRLLNMAGPPLIVAGRVDEAERVVVEAVALNEEMGAYGEVTLSLQILSYAAESRGDLERAAALLEDSIALAREHDILWILVSGLLNLGSLRFDQGHSRLGRRPGPRGPVDRARAGPRQLAIVEGLGLASAIAVTAGDDETGGRLWGAVERPYEEFGHSYLWDDMERFRQMLAERGEVFEDARRRGRLLTLEEGSPSRSGESA